MEGTERHSEISQVLGNSYEMCNLKKCGSDSKSAGLRPLGVRLPSRHQSNPHEGKLVRKGSGRKLRSEHFPFLCNSAEFCPKLERVGLFLSRRVALLTGLNFRAASAMSDPETM